MIWFRKRFRTKFRNHWQAHRVHNTACLVTIVIRYAPCRYLGQSIWTLCLIDLGSALSCGFTVGVGFREDSKRVLTRRSVLNMRWHRCMCHVLLSDFRLVLRCRLHPVGVYSIQRQVERVSRTIHYVFIHDDDIPLFVLLDWAPSCLGLVLT